MAGFLGKGQVYLDRNKQGKYLPVGNAIKFAIDESDAEIKERISRQTDTYGQALDRVAIPKPAKISIEMDDFNANNLAAALRGNVEEGAGTGNVTDEEVTASIGNYVKLAHSGLSSVVVKDSGETTTYVEGTDYEVNTNVGLLKALESGDITDGETLKVSYDYDEAGMKILGSQNAEIKGALILDGINQVNGKPCRVYVHEARLKTTKEVDFLADDFATLALEGTLLTPEGKNEPYYIEYEE